MAQVVRDKEKDEILRYIYQEYDKWIRKCVEPRDAIIHYDDITIKYYLKYEGNSRIYMSEKENKLAFRLRILLIMYSRFILFRSGS